MTQTVDLSSLDWQIGPRVALMRAQTIAANGAGDELVGDPIGFDDLDTLYLVAHVGNPRGTDPELTLLLEHRDAAEDEWETAATYTFNRESPQRVLQTIENPKARVRASWTLTGTNQPRYPVRTFSFSQAPVGEVREISETYGGEHSYQSMAADLELETGAGKDTDSAFLAPGMGNLLGNALTKTKNYLFGWIGAFSVTGTKATEFQAGGVAGIIMDGVTEADAGVVSILDGSDPSAETRATAAFAARQNNNNPASGVDYGLDLYDPGRDDLYSDPGPGLPLAIAKADIRGSNEVCYLNGDGPPVDYTDGSPPATGEGYAGPGSFYIDRTNGDLYVNTGTKAEPVWTEKAGGGGSQPAGTPVLHGPLTIAYDDVGLTAGIDFYTPEVDEILMELWLERPADGLWDDAMTPKFDVGTFVGTNFGLFSNDAPIGLDGGEDDPTNGTGLLLGQNLKSALSQVGITAGLRLVPSKFTATNPLKFVVSQDGTKGGDPVGGTHGFAYIHWITIKQP